MEQRNTLIVYNYFSQFNYWPPGTEIFCPRNIAFKNSLLVPYHVPLKFGLSAKIITLPDLTFETIKEDEPGILFFMLFLDIYPSMWGFLE